MKKYRASCEKIQNFQDKYEYAVERLKLGKINCIKYNNNLDLSIQRDMCYDAIIKMSFDGQNIEILKKNREYQKEFILETDPVQVELMKKSAKKVEPKESLVKTNSFKVSEVKGLIFGGQSSRFWILRRHFNAMDK